MSESWEETKARYRKKGVKIKDVIKDVVDPVEPVAPKPRYDAQPMEYKVSKIPLYNLVSVIGGVRKIIGFNLTIKDAETLKAVAVKRLNKLPEPDEGGSPLFELTDLITEKVIGFGTSQSTQTDINWK